MARLLNAVARPIYIVDDEQTIIFANQACLDWIGCTADEIQGLKSAYHSSSEVSDAEAIAAGLCPPPAAMAGLEVSGTVEIITRYDRLSSRRARFVPLGRHVDEPAGLIVLVDSEDLSESTGDSAIPEESEASRLHRRVRRFRREAAVRFGADRLVGDSPAMRRARAQVELAAAGTASVLVVGPEGSGRQHIAGTIHYASDPDSTGAMIPLACSVLGSELIESTVGAIASQKGKTSGTGGGTLLLNDADQIPAEIQSKLAETLGGESFPSRLIATARKPLAELARQGNFRHDLAAVLSTIVIELPRLVERREDLPLLSQLFVEEANLRSRKQVAGFSPEALDRLDAYHWPGNIDELAQMVEESHTRAKETEITPGDLPRRIHQAAAAASHPPRVEETIDLDEFLGRVERELIARAMAQAKGNKSKAARMLGMTRPRLYRRMVQLGLVEE